MAALQRTGQRLLRNLESMRCASSSAAGLRGNLAERKQAPATAAAAEDRPEVVYNGVMASTLRKVKLLSFSTFVLSSFGSPFMVFFTYPEVSAAAKGAIGSAMIMLSASTTAALHWFASPYVRQLKWKPGSPQFEVETLSMVAIPLRRTLNLSDIRVPETQRPLVTFMAKKHYYYVDEDTFPSAELLKKLKKPF